MDKTGKRVDVTRAVHDHSPEGFERLTGEKRASHDEYGRPVLYKEWYMIKRVKEYTPTHDCPDWARSDLPDADSAIVETEAGEVIVVDGGRQEHIYRYDERGDQVCVNCGDIRNQSPDVVHDHQHSGRFDGFNTE